MLCNTKFAVKNCQLSLCDRS